MAASTTFGVRLRALRILKGLTQTELADRCGLDLMTVARIEWGTREPRWTTALKLAEVLGVPITEFIDPRDQETPANVEPAKTMPVKRGRGRPPKRDASGEKSGDSKKPKKK
jgi:transcriptional regulator with XRE-family HTH domain